MRRPARVVLTGLLVAAACDVGAAGVQAGAVLTLFDADEMMCLDRSTVETADIQSNPSPPFLVMAKLTPFAASKFAELTLKYLNKPLRIRLDGKLISEPIIRNQMIGGTVPIGVADRQSAGAIVEATKSPPCPRST